MIFFNFIQLLLFFLLYVLYFLLTLFLNILFGSYTDEIVFSI